MLILLQFVCFFFVAVQSVNTTCQDPSLYIDIHQRIVDGKSNFYQYGLFIGIGTPSQNQSLWPSISNNETYVAGNGFCGKATASDCNSFTHGHFGAEASTSWAAVPQYETTDTTLNETALNVTSGTDDLHLFTHFFDPSPPSVYTLPDYPANILEDYESPVQPFFTSGSIGLGPDSVLLTQMKNAGRITSRIVGLYLGTAYARSGGLVNGSMVLGGYDQGRIKGEAHEYQQVAASKTNTPYKLRVKQVALVLKDNTTIGLVTDDGFDAYLSTAQYELDLPGSVAQNLATALSALPASASGDYLQASKPFDGNLTITLHDDFTITFPPEWITNTSNRTPFSSSTLSIDAKNNATVDSEANDLIFGAAFLHHLYMVINHETSTFTLSEAKLLGDYVQPTSLCLGQLAVPPAPIRINEFLRKGMIGVILGSILGAVGVFGCLWFCCHKRRAYVRSRKAVKRLELGTNNYDHRPSERPKGSLRTRTKHSLVRFATRNNVRTIHNPLDEPKRVSWTDSEADSTKGSISIGISRSLQQSPTHGHEMTTIPTSQRPINTSPPPYSLSSQYSNQSTPQRSIYPLPTPTPTPNSGNPLLSRTHPMHAQFGHFDDNDTSDLPHDPRNPLAQAPFYAMHPPVPYHHTRQNSTEGQKRFDLGLTVDTAGAASRRANPGRVVERRVKRRDEGKRNPVRALLGIENGNRGGSGTRNGGGMGSSLRRMFPAS